MIRNLTCGIVFYDEVDEIQRLIPQLKSELSDYRVDWLFILNHEQSAIRQWIKNWILENITNAVCIENPSNNLGFARQLILENSKTAYIYMTDPDINLKPSSLIKLIQLAETESLNDRSLHILGYGGTVINTSTNSFLQSTNDFIFKLAKKIPFSFQIQNHSHLATVDHLPSCHLLLKKEESLAIGGFSANFKKVGEDLDFSHRAYNEDFRFVFLPSSQVYHHQNMTVEKWLYKMFVFGRVQITVQKLNYGKGLRLYRFLPLVLLSVFIALSCFFYIQVAVLIFALLSLSLLRPAFLGFTLTSICYALGELFEIIYPTVELKNEQELRVLTEGLISEVQKAKA
jgi:GT2 family glycosyltransferase